MSNVTQLVAGIVVGCLLMALIFFVLFIADRYINSVIKQKRPIVTECKSCGKKLWFWQRSRQTMYIISSDYTRITLFADPSKPTSFAYPAEISNIHAACPDPVIIGEKDLQHIRESEERKAKITE